MKDPISQESALSLVDSMRGGRTTAVAVMRTSLERIKALELDVRAFAHFDAAAALNGAERADKQRELGGQPGPLHGLPVAVKDIIDTADFPTEYGGEIFLGRQPERDATIVKRLRAAGAIVIGKTVTSQYALFVPGPANAGRLVERIGGGGRRRIRSRRFRDPDQWVGYPARFLLRNRRIQAQPRRPAPHRGLASRSAHRSSGYLCRECR